MLASADTALDLSTVDFNNVDEINGFAYALKPTFAPTKAVTKTDTSSALPNNTATSPTATTPRTAAPSPLPPHSTLTVNR